MFSVFRGFTTSPGAINYTPYEVTPPITGGDSCNPPLARGLPRHAETLAVHPLHSFRHGLPPQLIGLPGEDFVHLRTLEVVLGGRKDQWLEVSK